MNLFIASELNWEERKFKLRQETKFPEEAGTTLTVDADEPVALTLRVRIPGWVAGAARVKINGKQSDVSAEAGSYLAIARTWVKGDRVEIGLPMALHSEGMADDTHCARFCMGQWCWRERWAAKA